MLRNSGADIYGAWWQDPISFLKLQREDGWRLRLRHELTECAGPAYCCVLNEALSETRVPPGSEKPPKHREDRNFLWFLFVLQLFVFTLLDGFYENGSSAAGLPWLLTSSHFKHGALNKRSLLWPQHVLLTEINKEDSGVVQAWVQRQSAFVHREKCFMFKSFKQTSRTCLLNWLLI